MLPSGDVANGNTKYTTRTDPGADRLRTADALLLFAAGAAVRARLVLTYPGVHGGDAVARLAHSDTLVLAYQLPLPQLLVFLTRAADPDPTWTRLVFAAVGALFPVALALALAPVVGGAAARSGGLLAALHPLFVYYSLVPYQEAAMLLLLLGGAAALHRGSERTAGLLVGLACLCRYEAWIGAAIAVAAAAWHWSPRRLAQRFLLFAWAPLAWSLWWRGLSPDGTYVLDHSSASGALTRLGFLWGKLREYSGDVLLVLAALGAAWAMARRPRPLVWAAAYVTLMTAAVAVAGHEFPVGSGRVSERLAHVPAAAACALAGLAVGALWSASRGRTRPIAAAVLALVLATTAVGWLRRSEALVAEANRDPSTVLALRIASFARDHLPRGGRLAVAAPPVPAEEVERYVERIRRGGGDVRRARELARALATRSVDGNRIAAHLPRDPRTVVAAGSEADLIVVYDDAPQAGRWRAGVPLVRFTAGARAATMYATGRAVRGPSAPAGRQGGNGTR